VSKIITSPSARWVGSVTLADPLNMLQVELFEAGLKLPDEAMGEGTVYLTVLDKPMVPALLACVETWSLKDFPASPTLETFPFTPRKDSHELIAWLTGEIRKVYLGEFEIPNESGPTPTAT
jgi:hypothetical protein